jgi:hypothetical protein
MFLKTEKKIKKKLPSAKIQNGTQIQNGQKDSCCCLFCSLFDFGFLLLPLLEKTLW